jgi:hypothetical protein
MATRSHAQCGRATLIDDASAQAFLAGLPRLQPKAGR